MVAEWILSQDMDRSPQLVYIRSGIAVCINGRLSDQHESWWLERVTLENEPLEGGGIQIYIAEDEADAERALLELGRALGAVDIRPPEVAALERIRYGGSQR